MEPAYFEDLPLSEDFFHGHGGDDDPGLTLDDALDDILNMAPPSGSCRLFRPYWRSVCFAGQEHSILSQRVGLIFRPDGEDCR